MNNDFIKRLCDARSRSGIKQSQIADYFNISEQAVGKWFRSGNVAKEKLPLLADLLDVSLHWLMTGENLQDQPHDPYSNSTTKELLQLFAVLNREEKDDVMKIVREKSELHTIREELAQYKKQGVSFNATA